MSTNSIFLLILLHFDCKICNCLFPIVKNDVFNCHEVKDKRECHANEVLSAIVKKDKHIVPYRDGFIGKNRQADLDACIKYCFRVDECIAISFINKTCNLFSIVTRTYKVDHVTSSFLSCCKDLDIVIRTPMNTENCVDLTSAIPKCPAGKTLMWGFTQNQQSAFGPPTNKKIDLSESANTLRRECLFKHKDCHSISYAKKQGLYNRYNTYSGHYTPVKQDKDFDFYILLCCAKQPYAKKEKVYDEHLETDPIANSCHNIKMLEFAKCKKPEWEIRPNYQLHLTSAIEIMNNTEISKCKEQCLTYSMCQNFVFYHSYKICILYLEISKNKRFTDGADFYELVCCEDYIIVNTSSTTVNSPFNMKKYEGYTEAPPHSTYLFFAMVILFTVICIFIVIVSYVLCYCRNHFTEINRRQNSNEEEDDENSQ